jgi:hypothetical protein
MDAAQIQAKIWYGYAKSAGFIGSTYKFYRPGTPPPPVDQTSWDASGSNWDAGGNWDQPGNFLFALPVSLNAEDMTYKKPRGYAKATWYALVDGTNLQVGDYFIGPMGTFFIAAMQSLLPILAVQCNRVVSVFRPQIVTGVGAQGYGGNTTANETPVIQGRPCSILQGTKGEKAEGNLPGDTRAPWWVILMPYAGADILMDDIITDDLGRRYVVSSAELSALGYRITAMSALP